MHSMRLLLLLRLLVFSSSQRLDSPDGDCDVGFVCKSHSNCPQYLAKKELLDSLKSQGGGSEYEDILEELKGTVCNKAERGVCCEESFEVVNGNIVRSVEEMPFIARLSLKTGTGSSSICGASLIASQYLLSAKHCFPSFYDQCIDEHDCVAHFRDLTVRGVTSHDRGQFVIPIFDIFERSGLSDLVVVKLKHPVEEHEDYSLGAPLRPIQLAKETPKAGEVATTAGWGLLGYKQGLSSELRSLSLTITTAQNIWLYTSSFDSAGRITDPCDGDSGGPLFIERDGHWELVGVLKGEGFDCRTNKTAGDGEWSNVAVQRQWIERRLVPGAGKGEISLRPAATNLLGGNLVKGNVYLDEKPVCDDGFGREEARVVCRMLGYNLGFPEEKSTYGPAELGEEFWRSHLQCQGDEESLEDCAGKENPSCTRGEVAGVTCFLGADQVMSKTTTTATTTNTITTAATSTLSGPGGVVVLRRTEVGTTTTSTATTTNTATTSATSTLSGPGGVVVLRRKEVGNPIDYFDKTFAEYKAGFASKGESWLGLEKLHQLTYEGNYNSLKITMTDFDNKTYVAVYDQFQVGPGDDYVLRVGGFNQAKSTLGDSLVTRYSGESMNGRKFATWETAKDSEAQWCALQLKTGWWFSSCGNALLTGQHTKSKATDNDKSIFYYYGGDRVGDIDEGGGDD